MAVDKKLKNEANLIMKVLDIDPDTWLNEKYSEVIEDKKEEFTKKVLEMHSTINS